MKTITIGNLIELCRAHGFDDLQDRIMTVCDSVISEGANPDRAFAEIEEIADIVQEKIEDAQIPPDEEQLLLLNPSFPVD